MGLLISLAIAWLFIRLFNFRPPRAQLNCGIWGYSGARPVDVIKLRWLAAENQSRGTDSTGVYGNHLFKEKGPAKEVFLMPGFHAAVKGAHTVQGHDRQASAGYSVTKDNAHPFQYGHEEEDGIKWAATVVGAHNGFVIPEMLRHHEEYFGFKKYFSVDSQVIFAALAKTGDVNVISKIEGGMALSFQILSDDPNKLYLYKREETRPLYLGEAADGLYYSSLETPLRYIGCKVIWELKPNFLYTLKDGEILDMYKMPAPILKSLAANVSRGDWRRGVPHVEVSALPISVTSETSASGSGKNKFQRDFGFGNHSGFTQNKSSVIRRLGDEYKSKSNVENKFRMLINNISEELKRLNVLPNAIIDTTSREDGNLSSCALVIRVVTAEHNRGLPAWAILADGDKDLAGLTSGNGITIIKVPAEKCGKPLRFMAYSPVEEYGPYDCIITPEAARVVEVTLSIPFLKNGGKKTEEAQPDNKSEHNEGGNGAGSVQCPTFPFGAESEIVYGDNEGNDCCILPATAPKVSGRHSGQSPDGVLDYSDPLGTVVPSTELELSNGPELADKESLLLLNRPEKERRTIIDIALEEKNGKYTAYSQIPAHYRAWAVALPDREFWVTHFQKVHFNELKTSELIMDALRLVQRDRWIANMWHPFWVYLEILLRERFTAYIRLSVPATSLTASKFWPSTLLKKK